MNRLRALLGRFGARSIVMLVMMLAVVGSSLVLVIMHPQFGTRPSTTNWDQNFVTGNIQIASYAVDCKINVSVVASGDSVPTRASGMITMAALPGCSGEMVARVNCLIVKGNQAQVNGAIIQATGIFAQEPPGVIARLIENPPAHGGKPTDQAYFQPSRPRDCPPHSDSSGPVPQVLEGGAQVHQAG